MASKENEPVVGVGGVLLEVKTGRSERRIPGMFHVHSNATRPMFTVSATTALAVSQKTEPDLRRVQRKLHHSVKVK